MMDVDGAAADELPIAALPSAAPPLPPPRDPSAPPAVVFLTPPRAPTTSFFSVPASQLTRVPPAVAVLQNRPALASGADEQEVKPDVQALSSVRSARPTVTTRTLYTLPGRLGRHDQLSSEQAFKFRAEIEAAYVLSLRLWEDRASAGVQTLMGRVDQLIQAHSQLSTTFEQQLQQYRREKGKNRGRGDIHRQQCNGGDGHTAEQQQAEPELFEQWVVSDVPAQPQQAVPRKRSVKRSIWDGRTAPQHLDFTPGAPPQPRPKRHRAGAISKTAPAAPDRIGTAAAAVLDDPAAGAAPAESIAGAGTNGFVARPRRAATKRRETLLTTFQLHHFSLHCFSIANAPVPPSVDFSLYTQTRTMLRAQFPRIGNADQPSTSYYACLCIDPASSYWTHCLSLLPAPYTAGQGAAHPLVLSASLFDLADSLYFRILFFTSPLPSHGFASFLLSHLRFLSSAIHTRTVVCATRAQNVFWLSQGFVDVTSSCPPGLAFGDTMLMGCDGRCELEAEENRARLGEEALRKVKERARERLMTTGVRRGPGRPPKNRDAIEQRQREQQQRAVQTKREEDSRSSRAAVAAGNGHGTRRKARRSAESGVTADSNGRDDAFGAVSVAAAAAAGRQSHARLRSSPSWAFPSLITGAATAAPRRRPGPPPRRLLDPLFLYHPYIVRHLRTRRLFPIKGPPLSCRYSSFLPLAPVVCATRQAGYHKGGCVLYSFTLQYGEVLDRVDGKERAWRVRMGESEDAMRERLMRYDRRAADPDRLQVLEVDEQFIYPLPDGWRERYCVREPSEGGKRKALLHCTAMGATGPNSPDGGEVEDGKDEQEDRNGVKDEKGWEAENDEEEEEDEQAESDAVSGHAARPRVKSGTVMVLTHDTIDLVDDDNSTGSSDRDTEHGDELLDGVQQHHAPLSTPTLHVSASHPNSPVPLALYDRAIPPTPPLPPFASTGLQRLQPLMPLSPVAEAEPAGRKDAAIDCYELLGEDATGEADDGDDVDSFNDTAETVVTTYKVQSMSAADIDDLPVTCDRLVDEPACQHDEGGCVSIFSMMAVV